MEFLYLIDGCRKRENRELNTSLSNEEMLFSKLYSSKYCCLFLKTSEVPWSLERLHYLRIKIIEPALRKTLLSLPHQKMLITYMKFLQTFDKLSAFIQFADKAIREREVNCFSNTTN